MELFSSREGGLSAAPSCASQISYMGPVTGMEVPGGGEVRGDG